MSIDDLMYVATYPSADTKALILGSDRQRGGPSGTSPVTVARLRARCAQVGVLGVDELSELAVMNFVRVGIDVSALCRRPGIRPIRSTIVVGREDLPRPVLSDPNGVEGPDPDRPSTELARSSRVLFVDHAGVPGMSRAVRIAREAGVAVVADFGTLQGAGLPHAIRPGRSSGHRPLVRREADRVLRPDHVGSCALGGAVAS